MKLQSGDKVQLTEYHGATGSQPAVVVFFSAFEEKEKILNDKKTKTISPSRPGDLKFPGLKWVTYTLDCQKGRMIVDYLPPITIMSNFPLQKVF